MYIQNSIEDKRSLSELFLLVKALSEEISACTRIHNKEHLWPQELLCGLLSVVPSLMPEYGSLFQNRFTILSCPNTEEACEIIKQSDHSSAVDPTVLVFKLDITTTVFHVNCLVQFIAQI
jgi:hypothetical protein